MGSHHCQMLPHLLIPKATVISSSAPVRKVQTTTVAFDLSCTSSSKHESLFKANWNARAGPDGGQQLNCKTKDTQTAWPLSSPQKTATCVPRAFALVSTTGTHHPSTECQPVRQLVQLNVVLLMSNPKQEAFDTFNLFRSTSTGSDLPHSY